jgi:preprotein translocase subunit SecA
VHTAALALPIIANVKATQPQFENILIPFTDGKRTLQVVVGIDKALNSQGQELALGIEKGVTLSIIDNEWKEHLRDMDDLRQSVQNARFEQKDPLLIYKFESFNLFRKMIEKVSFEVVSFLSKAALPGAPEQVRTQAPPRVAEQRGLQASRPGNEPAAPQRVSAPGRAPMPEPAQRTEPVRAEKKVGRNDPCPCGSGKKYKQCHGNPVNLSV